MKTLVVFTSTMQFFCRTYLTVSDRQYVLLWKRPLSRVQTLKTVSFLRSLLKNQFYTGKNFFSILQRSWSTILVQMLIVMGLLFKTGSASTAWTGFPWINKFFSIMNKIYWFRLLALGSSHLKFDLSEYGLRSFTVCWYLLHRCRRVWDTRCLS